MRSSGPALRAAEPWRLPAIAMSRTDSLLLVLVVALAGASTCSAAQAALFVASISPEGTGFDPSVRAMIWAWVAISALAVALGLVGGYRAVRSRDVRRPAVLAFLVLYSVTLRLDNLSMGWPWQCHVGVAVGRVGLGLNLVGALLLIWYLSAARRPRSGSPTASIGGSSLSEVHSMTAGQQGDPADRLSAGR
jgi:hypothetical protein